MRLALVEDRAILIKQAVQYRPVDRYMLKVGRITITVGTEKVDVFIPVIQGCACIVF